MIIRTEQLRAFERHTVRGFISRMEEHLRSAFPEQTGSMSPAELGSRIEAAIQAATGFGLGRECDVEGYLNVICASSAGLDRDPPDWILQILADGGITAESKMELLYSGYRDRQHGK